MDTKIQGCSSPLHQAVQSREHRRPSISLDVKPTDTNGQLYSLSVRIPILFPTPPTTHTPASWSGCQLQEQRIFSRGDPFELPTWAAEHKYFLSITEERDGISMPEIGPERGMEEDSLPRSIHSRLLVQDGTSNTRRIYSLLWGRCVSRPLAMLGQACLRVGESPPGIFFFGVFRKRNRRLHFASQRVLNHGALTISLLFSPAFIVFVNNNK